MSGNMIGVGYPYSASDAFCPYRFRFWVAFSYITPFSRQAPGAKSKQPKYLFKLTWVSRVLWSIIFVDAEFASQRTGRGEWWIHQGGLVDLMRGIAKVRYGVGTIIR